MMDALNKTLILKGFKKIGLNSYMAKSYLSLLGKDTLTVTEVSRIAEIPRANAYEALDKLMLRGMCIAKPGGQKKYTASNPDFLEKVFLADAKNKADEELEKLTVMEKNILDKSKKVLKIELKKLEKKRKEIINNSEILKDTIAATTKELKPQFEKSRLNKSPLEYIEIIKDARQGYDRYMQLLNNAKEEILIFSKPPYSVSNEKLEEQVDQQVKTMKRKVIAKSIYEIPEDDESKKWLLTMIDRAVKSGEEAKVIKELPIKMVIFDSKIVMSMMENHVLSQDSLTAQIVEHSAMAKSLKLLFETLWQQAEDYNILRDKGGD